MMCCVKRFSSKEARWCRKDATRLHEHRATASTSIVSSSSIAKDDDDGGSSHSLCPIPPTHRSYCDAAVTGAGVYDHASLVSTFGRAATGGTAIGLDSS